MRKMFPMRMLMEKHVKKYEENKYDEKKRFLINVNVVGSAGPLRFVVSESDSVKRVISSALKLYAREGRLPVLGTGASSFNLFPANTDFNALEPSVLIGSPGVRNFSLCKKKSSSLKTEVDVAKSKKKKGNLKTWIDKLLYHHHSHRSNNLLTS